VDLPDSDVRFSLIKTRLFRINLQLLKWFVKDKEGRVNTGISI